MKWMDHIDAMDQFRKGIGLRALGQRDPVVEYRMEGFEMFEATVDAIREQTVWMLFHTVLETKISVDSVNADAKTNQDADGRPVSDNVKTNANTGEKPMPVRAEKRVGRNQPCPCGSGKKYKNCCGKNVS